MRAEMERLQVETARQKKVIDDLLDIINEQRRTLNEILEIILRLKEKQEGKK